MQETRDFPQRIVGQTGGHRGKIHAQSTRIGNGGQPSCFWFILKNLGIYQIFIVCAVVYMQRGLNKVCLYKFKHYELENISFLNKTQEKLLN